MKRYILDSNVFIKYPEALDKIGNELEIAVPGPVLGELASIAQKRPEVSLILQVIEKSDVVLISSDFSNKIFESFAFSGIPSKVSAQDFLILECVKKYKDRNSLYGENITFVTSDIPLLQHANSLGIRTISADAFDYEINSISSARHEYSNDIESIKIDQKRYLFRGLGIGIAATLLAVFVARNISAIIEAARLWGSLLGIILLGLLLFWFRTNYRFSYGIFEFLSGVAISFHFAMSAMNTEHIQVISFIQLLGGIYIIVRGLDNIGQGISGTKYERVWNSVF